MSKVEASTQTELLDNFQEEAEKSRETESTDGQGKWTGKKDRGKWTNSGKKTSG